MLEVRPASIVFGRLGIIVCVALVLGTLPACERGRQVVVTPVVLSQPIQIQDAEDRHATTRLALLSQQALRLTQQHIPDTVIRQLTLDGIEKSHMFHFTDVDSTRLVTIVADTPDTPSSQWEVTFPEIHPLLTWADPGIDFNRLQFGPVAAVREAVKHWPRCESTQMLLWSDEPELTWQVTCNSGGVQIRMDGITGASSVYPDY